MYLAEKIIERSIQYIPHSIPELDRGRFEKLLKKSDSWLHILIWAFSSVLEEEIMRLQTLILEKE